MDLSVKYQQASGPEEAYNLAKAQITPEYVAKFNIPADISYQPDNGVIEAVGRGFSLSLKFTEAEVQVSLNLTLLLRPVRGRVLEAIERKLRKHI